MITNESRHQSFLRELTLFKNLNDSELQLMIHHLTMKEVPEDGIVFEKYSKEQVLYIVHFGRLKIEPIGNDIIFLEKGDFFGEIGLLNTNYRTGTVTAMEPSMLFCLNGLDLVNELKIPARTALKIIIELGRKITSYFITSLNTSTQSLIEGGETETVEFKSTLRFNLFSKKFDKEIEHASLKTIAAFLNSSGGTLLIGIDDKKNVLGLDADNFRNEDHMFLHLTKLIGENIGMIHTQFISMAIDKAEEGKVLRVDVKPSPSPVYINHKDNEVFYIRSGPSTSQLRVSELYHYLSNRFYGNTK